MKKLILMFVMLITGIANAQTFNFECGANYALYSGDRPTELTAEQTADANAATTEAQRTTVISKANYTDYYATPYHTDKSIVITDEIDTILDSVYWPSTATGLNETLTPAQFRALYLEVIQAIWDLVNPNAAPLTHADRSAVLEAYNSIDGISNIKVKLSNSNDLSLATVYLTWDLNGVAQPFYYFSATNPTSTTDGEVRGDLSYYTPEQFETNKERLYNKLIDHTIDHVGNAITAIYDAPAPPTQLGSIFGCCCNNS